MPGQFRAHLGSFAIALAIVFGAGTFGFVYSNAFAVFFIGLVLFAVIFGIAVSCFAAAGASNASGDWVIVLVGLSFVVFSLMILFKSGERALALLDPPIAVNRQ